MAVKAVRTTNTNKNTKPVTTTANKANTSSIGSRPYSSPNTSTANTKPVTTTANKSSTVTNTGRNTVTTSTPAKAATTTNTVKNTNPVQTPTYTAPAVSTPTYTAPSNNTSRVTQPTPTVSTPTVSTPTITAPTSVGMAGTAINPGAMFQTSVERMLQEQAEQTLDPHTLNSQMVAKPNETPAETTNRYLGVLGSVTGANGSATRPYSNPNYAFNTSNTSKNTGYDYGKTLDEIVEESVYNSLVGEPGSSAPFTAVPQYSLNNANLAVNGPTAVVANQQNKATLSDLIAAQLAGQGIEPTTNNPLEAMITGATFDPYAANGGVSYGDIYNDIDNSEESNVYRRGDGLGTGPVGTGSIGIGAETNLDALYDLLNAQLAEYNNQYNSLMENLLAAYGMNNDNLDAYYQQVLNALGNNYADTESLLRGQFGNSQQALEDDRRRALQEAYISRMMAEKQLADQLDAYGLTGGASESVMANLRNNYMNNRASVEEKTQTSLKDLLQNYLSNLSNARQNYNQSLMNAQQSRLNAQQNYANNLAEAQASAANYLANARSGAYENLFNALAKQYLG